MTFPYRNLEAAIRKAMARPAGAIYISQVAALTSLRVDDRFISSLADLEHCIGLEKISLRPNTISDISPPPTSPRANYADSGIRTASVCPPGTFGENTTLGTHAQGRK
jgi:hypothetical protein